MIDGKKVSHRPPWFSSLKDVLSHAPRAVRIISPCAGLNAPERAARELEIPWQSTGDYEINTRVLPSLEFLCENHSVLQVGKVAGNVCGVPLENLDNLAAQHAYEGTNEPKNNILACLLPTSHSSHPTIRLMLHIYSHVAKQ